MVDIATGITVDFGTLSGEIVDVNKAADSVEAQDTSHQLSTDQWRTHSAVAAMKQGGEITLLANWGGTVPAVGTNDTLTLTLPSGHGVSATAILQNAHDLSGTLGQKITENMTFLISGEPSYT